MANELDETDESTIRPEGRDTHVIEKKIAVKVGVGSTIFQVILWVLGIIPGVIFLFMKIKAKNYLRGLQQKVQSCASTIDNYMEQRVMILKNAAKLLDKAVDLDKEVLEKVAAYRGGANHEDDAARNETAQQIEGISRSINVAFEAYPNIKAHAEIADAMQQNSYLQREITAARDLYNDAVLEWNQAIFQWPAKMIAAAECGYTTRIPFSTSEEIKKEARGTFF